MCGMENDERERVGVELVLSTWCRQSFSSWSCFLRVENDEGRFCICAGLCLNDFAEYVELLGVPSFDDPGL